MAYFAQLDFNNIVMQVLVVDDAVIGDATYPASESIGITFLQSLYGQQTNWKQTSPTGEFRKIYAHISGTYNSDLDCFVRPQPYRSWIYNPSANTWEAPIPYPTDNNTYLWDELTLSWIKTESKI